MIPYTPISLDVLKASAFLFYHLSGYDVAYSEAMKYQPLNPALVPHGKIVLRFLRRWGCRSLALKNETQQIRSLSEWYLENQTTLRGLPDIFGVRREHFLLIEDLFNDLGARPVSKKGKGIRMGAIAASKTLLLLKGDLFAPWDKKIIAHMEIARDGKGYTEYLQRIRDHLIVLRKECRDRGTSIKTIMAKMNRSSYALPKLIDEYYYLQATRKVDAGQLIQLLSS